MSKVRKTLDLAVKIIIALFAVTFLFFRFKSLPADQLNIFAESVIKNGSVTFLLPVIILLMFVNLGIETLKWQLLIRQIEKVSFPTAFIAILSGMATSIYTPNRVGEFVGRIFMLKNSDPYTAGTLTIIGGFSQLVITILFGTLAFLFFAPLYLSEYINLSEWLLGALVAGLAALSVALVTLFLNISVAQRLAIYLPLKYRLRLKSISEALITCQKALMVRVILLGALRYLVFSFQFFLCIRLMGANFSLQQCMMIIPLIYLSITAIPTSVFSELGVRSAVSLYLFGLLSTSNTLDATAALQVLSASTFIWMLNIAFPSLAGVFVVFRLKFFR